MLLSRLIQALVSLLAWSAAHSANTRGIIIDAGSLGSRLHIYQWNADAPSNAIIFPTTDESWTSIVQPGIANFAASPSKIRDHLNRLLQAALMTLKQESHLWRTYSIYFMATGGMRQLPFADRESIMEEVRGLLTNRSFCPFHFERRFARTISGEEEAVFSWLAVNYLFKTLDESENTSKSLGTLDLGGASTQIAFSVENQDISESLYRLQLSKMYFDRKML